MDRNNPAPIHPNRRSLRPFSESVDAEQVVVMYASPSPPVCGSTARNAHLMARERGCHETARARCVCCCWNRRRLRLPVGRRRQQVGGGGGCVGRVASPCRDERRGRDGRHRQVGAAVEAIPLPHSPCAPPSSASAAVCPVEQSHPDRSVLRHANHVSIFDACAFPRARQHDRWRSVFQGAVPGDHLLAPGDVQRTRQRRAVLSHRS